MSWPATLQLVTVAIRFDVPPAGGAYGKVTFTIPAPLNGPTDGSVVPAVSLTAYLAQDGTASIQLPATNDPDWTPTGWAYTVDAQVSGSVRTGTLQLDYQTASVQLADLVQWDGAAVAGQTYIPLSYRAAANGVASLGSDGKVPTAQLPASAVGVSSVAGRTGDVVLAAADITDSTATGRSVLTAASTSAARSAIGADTPATFIRAVVTSGDIADAVDAAFTIVPGLTLSLPAAVGDDVTLTISAMIDNGASTNNFYEAVVIVSGAIARYSSTGTGSPSVSGEGDPSIYPRQGIRFNGGTLNWSFTVAGGDLDSGNVVFGLAHKGPSGGKVFASTSYPFRWTARNDH